MAEEGKESSKTGLIGKIPSVVMEEVEENEDSEENTDEPAVKSEEQDGSNDGQKNDEVEVSFAPVEEGEEEPEPPQAVDGLKDLARLEDQLTHDKLMRLEKIFEEADEDGGGGLDMEEFRIAMRQTMGDHITDNELDMIFMKVDTNCDGTVDWDEYLTYMLLECSGKDVMHFQARQPFPRLMHRIKSEHRDSIIRILFIPSPTALPARKLLDDESSFTSHGKYLSVSKEGVLIFWNTEMKELCNRKIEPLQPKSKTVWVTDMVTLPGANTIALSTTARDIVFYDIGGNRFEKASRVTGIDACPMCLTVATNIRRPYVMLFMWGDDQGGVSGILFEQSPLLTAINPKRTKQMRRERIVFEEIMAGRLQYLRGLQMPAVHGDMVKQVMYCPDLECFISSSKDTTSSMYVGDLERKLITTYFRCNRGINTFQYFRNVNVIISGGYDGIVRVWNPYVPSKPSFLLHGHKSPVVHIHINIAKEHIVSIAENKEIRVHDFNTQTCVQTFFRKMLPDLGPRVITASFFHQTRQALLMATTVLCIMEHREEEMKKEELLTHSTPIMEARYNPLFNQVVSAGTDSIICVWNLATGQKDMQFHAHRTVVNGETVDMEVTALSFDPTFRRLITAGRDGRVRIWNFNNGALLRELPLFDEGDIMSIVCPKLRIITAGWNKRITQYYDNTEDDTVTWLMPSHREDILCLAYYPPNLLASCSFDGDIYIWSLETCRIILCFNHLLEGGRPLSPGRHTGQEAADNVKKRKRRRSKVKRGFSTGSRISGNSGLSSPSANGSGLSSDPTSPYPPMSMNESVLGSKPQTPVASQTKSAGSISRSRYQQQRTRWAKRKSTTSGEGEQPKKPRAVEKLMFLLTRDNHKDTASLFAACSDGYIRAWSVSHAGGLKGEYYAAKKPGEMILAMSKTDCEEFLITADSSGYIRIWDISHFCIQDKQCSEDIDAEREPLWEKFPYVSWTRKLTRIGLIPKHEPELTVSKGSPHLINSFRGHAAAINSIDYIRLPDGRQYMLTASVDCSLRLWTLFGEFVGLFGQNMHWNFPNSYAKDISKRILPPDVRKVASATTLRVLNGGRRSSWKKAHNVLLWLSATRSGRQKDEEAKKKALLLSLEIEKKMKSTSEVDLTMKPLPGSDILGMSYKRLTHHRPRPEQKEPLTYNAQCVPFRSLPCFAMAPTEHFPQDEHLTSIQKQYKLPPLIGTSGYAYKWMYASHNKPRAVGHKKPRPAVVADISNKFMQSLLGTSGGGKKSNIVLPAASASESETSVESSQSFKRLRRPSVATSGSSINVGGHGAAEGGKGRGRRLSVVTSGTSIGLSNVYTRKPSINVNEKTLRYHDSKILTKAMEKHSEEPDEEVGGRKPRKGRRESVPFTEADMAILIHHEEAPAGRPSKQNSALHAISE